MFSYYYPGNMYRQDINGVWNDDIGGRYYIRQIENEVAWYGERTPTDPSWSNVARGYVSDNQIFLRWVDVPKGNTLNSGNVVLRISSPNELQVTLKTGGFGPTTFRRVI